jgi:dTDP-4-dehydrorhamnose 3,5-epimerase
VTDSAPFQSNIPGVRWGTIARHGDARGSFRELWRAKAFDGVDAEDAGAPSGRGPRFVQSNLSTSTAGVLRGLHLHRRQLDHWVVTHGLGFVALVDVRPMIAGGDQPLVETRTVPADTTVTIPVGVAHGFLALSALDLVYFVTNEYDATDELGFAWDDPDAAVDWPAAPTSTGRPILSPRDLENPTLRQLVERLRA